MFEVKLLIPVADDAGKTFLPAHHSQFEALLVELFEGVTRCGSAEGPWATAGRLHRDQTIVYAVAVKSIVDGAKLAEVVAFAKAHYQQLAILIAYLGQAEVL